MTVYDVNGNSLSSICDANGDYGEYAYDVNGNEVFSAEYTTIKAMSFNVGCFYTQYFPCPDDKTSDFYQRHQTIFSNQLSDLCGMQEWYKTIGTSQASTLMGEFWEHTIENYEPYNGASNPNNAITLASKTPFSNASIVAYANQSGETRYYQKAYTTIGNKRICIVNTHLGTSDIRNAQFVELLNVLEQEEYFICFGDFNFRIESAGDSEYNLSVQLALNKGFNSAQNSDGIYMTGYHGETVATSSSIVALDNIITSANIGISNVVRDTTKLTDGLCEANGIIIDHLPIVAELTIH